LTGVRKEDPATDTWSSLCFFLGERDSQDSLVGTSARLVLIGVAMVVLRFVMFFLVTADVLRAEPLSSRRKIEPRIGL
jgi:hypothetical protein